MGILAYLLGSTKNFIQPDNADLRKAECPYCNGVLPKIPGSKTKCKSCGNFIYVRTRPKDNARVTVTKEQADVIDEEWSIVSGTHSAFVAEKEKAEREYNLLKKKFGREPSKNDVAWSLLNKELLVHAGNNDWGLYRNVKMRMADILTRELKLSEALGMYLEVCYIDLNEPRNMGGLMQNKELLKELISEFPPFMRNDDGLAPGIIDTVKKILKKQQKSSDSHEFKDLFLKRAMRIHKSLNVPVSPEEAWSVFQKKLEA